MKVALCVVVDLMPSSDMTFILDFLHSIPFAAIWMDLEIIILSEVSQIETDKYHMISLIWNLQYDTNELTYKGEIDSQT